MRFSPFHPATRLPLLAGLAALALLALMIATNPSKVVYDEPYHLDLAKSILASGWCAALTSPNNESAAGPLYPAIHIAVSPLTAFQAPAIRWVNFICLCLVIVTLAKTKQREPFFPFWIPALSILSVPYLWPATGMALTELPALLAFTLFVFALIKILRMPDEEVSVGSFGWAGVAGLALGLSILGRQTYLAVIPAVAALFLAAPKKWMLWLVCLAVAAGSCSWLFILWHGLVPPSQHHVASGIRLDFGVLSVSYVAAATLFLSPQWLKIRNVKVALLGSAFLGVGLALLSRDYANPPAKSLLLKIFGNQWGLLVGFCIGALLTAAAVVWVWNTLMIAWQERHEPIRVFLFLNLFALVAAPVMVSHLFSSRYVVGLLGVLVLVVGASQTSGFWLALRISIGSLAGAASLWTYFHQ
jgi:hypothetical protein